MLESRRSCDLSRADRAALHGARDAAYNVDVERVDTAIVLAIPVEGADPLERFAGLPLVLRTLLTLQKAGVRIFYVLASAQSEAKLRELVADARLAGSTTRVLVAPSRLEGMAALATSVRSTFLLASYEVLASPEVYARLGAATWEDRLGFVATEHHKRTGPLVASSALLGALATMARDEENVGALGAVALRAKGALDTAITRLFGDGRVAPLDTSDLWTCRLDGVDGRERAFRELFDACRKPVDGLVSRFLNRNISIWISKRLVDTSITPNVMSLITLALALAGSAVMLEGSYAALLAGAFALQWNSILDGVDGELARVRFQQSRLGQWIDTICDDVSNLAFYGALTFAVQKDAFARELAIAGYVAMGSVAITMLVNYVELARLGSGDFYALDWQAAAKKSAVVALFERVLKKDLFIFLYLALAIVGLLPFALAIAVVGHGIAAGAAIVRSLTRTARRA